MMTCFIILVILLVISFQAY
ncbi:type I toxin-antitoxin system Ibs family toxin [Shigella sonnei]|nr:type I toxin-antitoxin system Ibs family toxin [Shigella sonnei]MDD0628563.1 type I toxin-antitoxin system Ibs family toxin [Shigella sonnei]MDD0628565.1 type I toxin-antitoxin system Ibs family toxin [Shigella sonnei]